MRYLFHQIWGNQIFKPLLESLYPSKINLLELITIVLKFLTAKVIIKGVPSRPLVTSGTLWLSSDWRVWLMQVDERIKMHDWQRPFRKQKNKQVNFVKKTIKELTKLAATLKASGEYDKQTMNTNNNQVITRHSSPSIGVTKTGSHYVHTSPLIGVTNPFSHVAVSATEFKSNLENIPLIVAASTNNNNTIVLPDISERSQLSDNYAESPQQEGCNHRESPDYAPEDYNNNDTKLDNDDCTTEPLGSANTPNISLNDTPFTPELFEDELLLPDASLRSSSSNHNTHTPAALTQEPEDNNSQLNDDFVMRDTTQEQKMADNMQEPQQHPYIIDDTDTQSLRLPAIPLFATVRPRQEPILISQPRQEPEMTLHYPLQNDYYLDTLPVPAIHQEPPVPTIQDNYLAIFNDNQNQHPQYNHNAHFNGGGAHFNGHVAYDTHQLMPTVPVPANTTYNYNIQYQPQLHINGNHNHNHNQSNQRAPLLHSTGTSEQDSSYIPMAGDYDRFIQLMNTTRVIDVVPDPQASHNPQNNQYDLQNHYHNPQNLYYAQDNHIARAGPSQPQPGPSVPVPDISDDMNTQLMMNHIANSVFGDVLNEISNNMSFDPLHYLASEQGDAQNNLEFGSVFDDI